jgi:ABC-type lipoprotein export system ATPase subunit/predicted  nucleic acid-binding Zn-ribbon protein
MKDWVVEALNGLGGRGTILDISKHVWETHEDDIRAAGDLVNEWQYELRWSGDLLRKSGLIKSSRSKNKGIWELAGQQLRPKTKRSSQPVKGKYNFTQIQRVIFRNFSLYSKKGKNQVISEQIGRGVYCLAGANGLGKTTFLNALNYGLTGIVLEPNKEVLSPSDIVEKNKGYTKRYFTGRIKEKDKAAAEIEVLFSVNGKQFRIIRGFFQRDDLRLFEVFTESNGIKTALLDTTDSSPRALNEEYQQLLTQEIGFETFDHFIFYQLYVLTFDENRRMVFWDERASQHTMALAFNTSPDDTDRIIQLRRSIEKLESDGRNYRWDATQTRKKIVDLESRTKKSKDPAFAKLQREYFQMHKEAEKHEHSRDNIRIEYDALVRSQSRLYSQIVELRNEFARLFSKFSKPRSYISNNPSLEDFRERRECMICGSVGEGIVQHIERNLLKNSCPLCDTRIGAAKDKEQESLLKQIQQQDSHLAKRNGELQNLTVEAEGKKGELERAQKELDAIKHKIDSFEKKNSALARKPGKSDVSSLIDELEKQFELLDKESKESYRKRDQLKPEYERLLSKIEKAYKEAEVEFVPIFRDLAERFIGLRLNVQSVRTSSSIKLVLELANTARTESFQLSESQRFFLDIALRMSLAIFLSRAGKEATMLIDTPEGSLDIAYESRVGNMFSEFVKKYHQSIVMTANINASQLLVTLAKECGRENMKVRRMLGWTDLGPVQKQGEHLFEGVFQNIERALDGKNK